MSKQAEGSENMSSRDIILSRFQNVKSLLLTKNKLGVPNVPAKLIEKPQSPKNYLSYSGSDDGKLTSLIEICTEIQGKIREKCTEKAIFFGAVRKETLDIAKVEKEISVFKTFMKPATHYKECIENTSTTDYISMNKPIVSSIFCELTVKSFKVVSRVYQIIEFREEKKVAENFKKVPERQVEAEKPKKDPVKKKISEDPKPKILTSSYQSTQSRTKSPISQEKNPIPVVSFDQFMSNEKLGKNYSFSSVPKLSKQAQLLQFKEKAKEKERQMIKRKTSAMKIQAMYRGWKQRKSFIPLWERHKRKQVLAKLRKIASNIKALFAPYIILKALRSWAAYRKSEKLKLLVLFQEYSAVFIQKVWKGFKVRQHFYDLLQARFFAKSLIRGLVRGWKTRRILKCKEIRNLQTGIRDLVNLEEELMDSAANKSLHLQVSNQIPMMKDKFIKEVQKLYRNGMWSKTPYSFSSQNSIHESFVQNENLNISYLSSIRSREEVPVKPLQFNFDETEEVVEIEKPKVTFKNFLRRGQKAKYNPKDAVAKAKQTLSDEEIVITPRVPNEFNESFETPTPVQARPIKSQKKTRPIEDFEELDEVPLDLENKEAKPIHNFLKRKSQTYKPTKLEWKAKTRINCWGETSAPEVKKKPEKTKKTQNNQGIEKRPQTNYINHMEQIRHISFSRVQELEAIFSQLSKRHSTVNDHFGVCERTEILSIVPQFVPDSLFISQFTDDMYQETFETLQSHYLYLCNEEDMQ